MSKMQEAVNEMMLILQRVLHMLLLFDGETSPLFVTMARNARICMCLHIPIIDMCVTQWRHGDFHVNLFSCASLIHYRLYVYQTIISG